MNKIGSIFGNGKHGSFEIATHEYDEPINTNEVKQFLKKSNKASKFQLNDR